MMWKLLCSVPTILPPVFPEHWELGLCDGAISLCVCASGKTRRCSTSCLLVLVLGPCRRDLEWTKQIVNFIFSLYTPLVWCYKLCVWALPRAYIQYCKKYGGRNTWWEEMHFWWSWVFSMNRLLLSLGEIELTILALVTMRSDVSFFDGCLWEREPPWPTTLCLLADFPTDSVVVVVVRPLLPPPTPCPLPPIPPPPLRVSSECLGWYVDDSRWLLPWRGTGEEGSW